MSRPRIVVALAFVAALAAVACGGTPETAESASAASTSSVDADYAKMVGRWQFVYEGARREAVEAELAAKLQDPAALAAAKKEAEDEAASSTIELTTEHEYRSFVGDEMIFHERCGKMGRGSKPGSVACTPDVLLMRIVGGKPEMRLDGDELVMTDPRKGELRFRRK
jgi:hypothetical protein